MINLSMNTTNSLFNRNLSKTTSNVALAMQRMSTGCKINGAKDDAAGLSLSTKFTSQIMGLLQGKKNALSGLDLLNTGDSALKEMTKIAQRINELSVQASNGIYSIQERQMMQTEATELIKTLYQIKNSTEYNNKKIFKGVPKDGGTTVPVSQISESEALAKGYVIIKSAADFASKISSWGAGTAGKTFILMDDIDMSELAGFSKRNGFQGTFDGNGYTIKNLTIDMPSATRVGLFNLNNATVKNLTVSNANITGTFGVGVIAGEMYNSTITNCKVVNSTVNASGMDGGGLAGMAQNCTISNSEFNGVVNGPARSGGILGVNLGGTNIIKTAVSGAVKTQNEAGGILGWSSGTGSIIDSYSSAEVTGKRSTGGIAGHINAAGFTIENSCSTSNITQTDWGLTGGLVGSLAAGATVKNCYYTGSITGGVPNNVGGFSGNTAGSYTSCFWNIDTSGKTKSAPNSTVAGVVGLDNTQIENPKIYQDSGWDNGHWLFDNGIPYLSWQDVSNNFDFQVGATTAADSIFSVDTGFGLGDFDIDFTTQATSQDSIKSVQALVDRLLGKQAKMGASINALNSRINLGSVMYENLTGSKSTIMDTDIAKESANLVKNQVLQQLSTNYISQMRTLNKNTIMALLGG